MRSVIFPIMTALLLAAIPACTSPPDPNDPAVREAITEARNLGLAYLEENQLDEAETAFRSLIELDPSDAGGYANLGVVYLRRGELEQAERYLQDAAERDPNDPAISRSLSEVYVQMDQIDQARAVMADALERSPDDVPSLYQLARLYAGDPAETNEYVATLKAVVEQAPANVVPRFYFVESLLQIGRFDDALTQLIALQQQTSEIPREALPLFEEAIAQAEAGDREAALRAARFFHNLMKVTPIYQTSLRLLGVRADAVAGTPIISEPTGLTPSAFLLENRTADILGEMAFVDASQNARLTAVLPDGMAASAFALADYDGDGETDVLMAGWDEAAQRGAIFLLHNQFGRFAEPEQDNGLDPTQNRIRFALFADYDNDTLLDLYLVSEGPNRLFRNLGEGVFEDVGATAGVDDPAPGNKALFADLDHDGDLDLFVARESTDLVYRNNLDGTFTEIGATMNLAGEAANTTDVDFGDFDDDGDLDLLVSGERGLALYSNERQGRFEDVTAAAGLDGLTGVTASAAGDYNNDGFLDLFVGGADGASLFSNRSAEQKGIRFEREARPGDSTVGDARFLDFDNDGFLDLAIAGSPDRLLHNDGAGGFTDVTDQLIQENLTSNRLAFTDYNQDRDLDLFFGRETGVRLLRNDGGQLNRSLSVQTRGLLSNNSKNNYYSIGAKVEVRAGDLYQMRVVTDPVTYFGLGQRLKADVIRIVFTNGVPQNIFHPGTDQDIIEQQILKGSCPFLYTWNGSEFTFATDLLWRSALGMPLGILGGETAYAPADPAQDYIMVPDGLLQPHAGQYQLRITDELWETPFFDEVRLMVVDHPDSIKALIDERFGPPQPEPLPIYAIAGKRLLLSAVDGAGVDLLPKLKTADNTFTGPLRTTRFQGLMAPHDMILEPGAIDPASAVLYLKGWIFPTDASINTALSQSETYAPMPPQVQVKDAQGRWVTVIENMGFPMGKNKTVRVDLRGRFLSADHRVRIRTNLQIYWDEAFFAAETPDAPVRRTLLVPVSADLQYRGFSKMYRASPFGPHLFDYADVSTKPQWRDLEGRYTRYGDVLPLLTDSDDRYVIMNAGDEIRLAFDASEAPALPEGWSRSFILYSNGWLKDGDLNTAHGKTVEPLPFTGMSAYPYGPDERYPMTEANRRYLETYNTRIVTQQAFRDALKPLD